MGDVRPSDLAQARRYAQPLLRLGGSAVSPEALALVSHCLNVHVLPALPPQRPTSAVRIKAALGATLAGLMAARGADWGGGWTRRPLSHQSLAAEPIGRTHFLKVLRTLEADGLVEVAKGFLDRKAGRGAETRLRLTEAGLTLATEYGVAQGDVSSHFAGLLVLYPSEDQ